MAKFRTRARTVDMLGRQQIAGVPNAISELFKNAHDAYADHVEADYFFEGGLFVVRDDGVGMTEEEFEERWLTIGTEGKMAGGGGLKPPPKDPDKPERPMSGEKGIGRLAIAAIGPQVLVLTRAGRGNRQYDLVAAFIHWGAFELPGINLDEIDIPVRRFPGGTLPHAMDLTDMVNRVRLNLERFQERVDSPGLRRALDGLERFDAEALLNTVAFLADRGSGLTLKGDGRGTHFFVWPTVDTLAQDILADDEETGDISRLRRLLLGFTDTMTGGNSSAIRAAFRYWKSDDVCNDYLDRSEFWKPEDLEKMDHRLTGGFDEYGQFRGRVRIYDQKPVEYTLPWPGAKGQRTECGPFTVDIGHLQGAQRNSLLVPEEFARLNRKASRIGGIYIYRDGIRILPYGDVDFDWLEIEKRRNLGAGYYFFSHRRMVGAIKVTRNANPELQEKAGREGFRENKAYRELRAILMNFLVQVAANFFRDQSPEQPYRRRQLELERTNIARREAEKQANTARRDLERDLDQSFARFNDAEPQGKVAALLQSAPESLRSAVLRGGIDLLGKNLLVEQETRLAADLDRIRRSYRIEKPEGVGLTDELDRDLRTYARELDRLEEDVFAPAQVQLHAMVSEAARSARIELDRRERTRLLIESIVESSRTPTREVDDALRSELDSVRARVLSLRDQVLAETGAVADRIGAEVSGLDLDGLSPAEMERRRSAWKREIDAKATESVQIFNQMRAQLATVNWTVIDGHRVGMAAVQAAAEEELLALRKEAADSLEVSQLGMAIEIINHEFTNTIKAIRKGISELKPWSDSTPRLRPLYRAIHDNFEHLDGYLNLFTPLHRRLYRQAIEITGAAVADFLQDLFAARLKRDNIKLVASIAFRDKIIVGYPSTFYPVFVNLVDNSTYWLKDRPEQREIHLDADERGFAVSDTGPGIPLRNQEAVFERGWTTKPGGRGLGLYIARQVLTREGYDLQLDRPVEGRGATFRIVPVQGLNEGNA